MGVLEALEALYLQGFKNFVTFHLLAVTVLYMGKPPKMRKGNSRITEKGTQPKGQKKKAENASCCNDPSCDS